MSIGNHKTELPPEMSLIDRVPEKFVSVRVDCKAVGSGLNPVVTLLVMK